MDELNGPRGDGYRRMIEQSAAKRAGTPDEGGAVAARGRILYDFSGSACEGYALQFRQVSELNSGEGKMTLSDLRSTSWADQQEQVERLLAAGATRADVGQVTEGPEAVPFVVLADPEGNEFCVLGTAG